MSAERCQPCAESLGGDQLRLASCQLSIISNKPAELETLGHTRALVHARTTAGGLAAAARSAVMDLLQHNKQESIVQQMKGEVLKGVEWS